ncbi:DUF2975 domain-containing protein [Salinimicrobium sp. TH3]|uniref:DUF2975 domain-containing protein n=1 Tax=Salinimicrobium sp. TH3 TaxID=2997342 RepID=UPI002272B8FA|nr:DUF2975 domain-containing protein [Salinimicrobium sp. TH3]MCY2686287.1 DUF2975 domain-containing protein [Salinimicrobium sp. TH3]
MKQPILLKTILDICFILLALTFFGAVVIFILALIMSPDFYPIEVNDRILSEFTPVTIILVTSELAIGGLVLYTVYVLRKLVRSFFKGKLYTRFQIAALHLVGQLIVIITLAQAFTDSTGKMLIEAKADIAVGINFSFGSFWFVLAIGLFFMYLSKIFRSAKILKEENELTV